MWQLLSNASRLELVEERGHLKSREIPLMLGGEADCKWWICLDNRALGDECLIRVLR